MFQQAVKYKCRWMHPRSKHWHLIDFVLIRQCDLNKIKHTRVYCPTTTWSDHRLIYSKAPADSHNMKAFYDRLRAVYSPKHSDCSPLLSVKGTLLITDHAAVLKRWAEHFHSVLNGQSQMDVETLECPTKDN